MPRETNNSGTNSAGNSYTTYKDGSYEYNNSRGSHYHNDGAGHRHYTAPSGNDGWHHNTNQDKYTPGNHFRNTYDYGNGPGCGKK